MADFPRNNLTNFVKQNLNSNTNTNTKELEVARKAYQYNYTHIPSIAMVEELPKEEKFSPEWLLLVAREIRKVFVNTIITNRGNRGSQSATRDDVRRFAIEVIFKGVFPLQIGIRTRILQIIPQLFTKSTSKNFRELDDLFLYLLKQNGLSLFEDSLSWIKDLLDKGKPTGHIRNLKDYDRLYHSLQLCIPVPAIANSFNMDVDDTFAHMQVAGFNPLMIRRVNAPEPHFPVTETHYQTVMGEDDTMAAAGAEGRLYLVDYKILDGAVNGTFPQEQKYLYAPLALFAVPKIGKSDRTLKAIAIQCGQNPAENRIVTPNSGKYAWMFAKTVVHIADANYHEAVSHLARTHLFVGAFVMATHRQLPPNHPLSLLLRPHFAGTLAINDAAQKSLIAPGGGVDTLLAASIDSSRKFVVQGLQSYGFNQAMLPQQLRSRGVDDVNGLPVYPYRDDALLIWEAIHQWVRDYVGIYYPSDMEVRQDKYLAAWAQEVQAYDGGRIGDFGEENGTIQTRSYLIDAITLIIFTASAQHAVVNFPQKEIMSYAGIIPLAGYAPASILQKSEVTEADYLKLFPPLEQAQEQLNLLYLLGSTYYNKLGEYPANHFADGRVNLLLPQFQENLQKIEQIIERRNLERPNYPFLKPSLIPQSINI